LPHDFCKTHPELSFIIDAWIHLEEPTRQAILKLIRDAIGK